VQARRAARGWKRGVGKGEQKVKGSDGWTGHIACKFEEICPKIDKCADKAMEGAPKATRTGLPRRGIESRGKSESIARALARSLSYSSLMRAWDGAGHLTFALRPPLARHLPRAPTRRWRC